MDDLNCYLLKFDCLANYLMSFIAKSGLHYIPFGPTFYIISVDFWLDVIIIDISDKLGNFSKSPAPFISGHDYLFCSYILESTVKLDETIKYRNFRRCDHTSLLMDFNQKLIYSNVIKEDSVPNYLVSHLINSITSSLDKFASITVRKLSRPSSPWLTNQLKNYFRQRDFLYKHVRGAGDRNPLILYKNKRKELKIKLNSARECLILVNS